MVIVKSYCSYKCTFLDPKLWLRLLSHHSTSRQVLAVAIPSVSTAAPLLERDGGAAAALLSIKDTQSGTSAPVRAGNASRRRSSRKRSRKRNNRRRCDRKRSR